MSTKRMKTPISALLKRKPTALRSVPPTATVREAIEIMNTHRVGCVIILENDRLAGIFTERDVVTRVAGADLDPRRTRIAAVMTPHPHIVSPLTPIEEAMFLISERRVRQLPVIENECVVGLVSIGDINKWVLENLKFEADSLRSYVCGGYPG